MNQYRLSFVHSDAFTNVLVKLNVAIEPPCFIKTIFQQGYVKTGVVCIIVCKGWVLVKEVGGM